MEDCLESIVDVDVELTHMWGTLVYGGRHGGLPFMGDLHMWGSPIYGGTFIYGGPPCEDPHIWGTPTYYGKPPRAYTSADKRVHELGRLPGMDRQHRHALMFKRYLYTDTFICIYIYTHVYIYIYVYNYNSNYIYVYIIHNCLELYSYTYTIKR